MIMNKERQILICGWNPWMDENEKKNHHLPAQKKEKEKGVRTRPHKYGEEISKVNGFENLRYKTGKQVKSLKDAFSKGFKKLY